MKLAWLCNNLIIRFVWIFLLAYSLCACESGSSDAPPKDRGYSQSHNWRRITVAEYETSGMHLPYVVARQAANGNVHFAYYNAVAGVDDTNYFQLNHLVWNPETNNRRTRVVDNRPAPSNVDGFDNCEQFDMAVDGNTPILIYPTYEIDTVLQQLEADIMVNAYESRSWNENTGAVGFVPRNPVYQDGHITENMSMVVDSNGDVHFCYQYFTEGMDSGNFRYPDIYYTFRERATLSDPMEIADYEAIEERVDGNVFSTYGDHNSVGYHCKLLLDPEGLPVIVYGQQDEQMNGTFALKVAYKNSEGQWRRETVVALDNGWTVGGISAAFYPPDPDFEPDPDDPEAEEDLPLTIAYALRSPSPEPDDGHRLMFAVKQEGQWTTEIVDETTWCGMHCSLAFTPDRFPAIAYFDEQSHSGRIHYFLKYAEFNGVLWVRESADEEGTVGRSNTLWFDGQGRPNICTYSEEDNEVLVIQQTN